ncbi:hypothetical protein AB0P21_39215 [Kribbella sp. NPDC056861]|uniref:hypothetical protein n=1 Tax=Kribbella sp. NPDC056861 TaxID=3154857 RepID=UPI003418BFD9
MTASLVGHPAAGFFFASLLCAHSSFFDCDEVGTSASGRITDGGGHTYPSQYSEIFR